MKSTKDIVIRATGILQCVSQGNVPESMACAAIRINPFPQSGMSLPVMVEGLITMSDLRSHLKFQEDVWHKMDIWFEGKLTSLRNTIYHFTHSSEQFVLFEMQLTDIGRLDEV